MMESFYARWNNLGDWEHFDLGAGERHSSYPIEEATSAVLLVLAVAHALAQVDESRRMHCTLLVCAFLGGIGGDVVFSYLPLADNFFHAQGTVMITPRLPLHIPFFYLGWYYVPMAISWRLCLSFLSRCALVSALSLAYYWPWDVVGAKMLWWTWHSTDSGFQERYLLVPLASTVFVLVQGFCWAVLTSFGMERMLADGGFSWRGALRTWGYCLWTVPGLLTVMPIVQIATSLQAPPPPTSHITVIGTMAALVLAFVVPFFVSGYEAKRISQPTRFPSILFFIAIARHWMMAYHAVFSNSEEQVSVGVHQQFGPCEEFETDFTGSRYKFLCPNKHTWQDFKILGCVDSLGNAGTDATENPFWFTVCGTPKSQEWLDSTLALIATCSFCFILVGFLSNSDTQKSKRA